MKSRNCCRKSEQKEPNQTVIDSTEFLQLYIHTYIYSYTYIYIYIYFLLDTSKYPDMISIISISVLQSLVSCLVASQIVCVSSMAVLQCLK